MARININGTYAELTEDNASEAMQVIEDMGAMMDVILDALEYRTGLAIDNEEGITMLARLALAHHFIASTKERHAQETSQVTPGAGVMTS